MGRWEDGKMGRWEDEKMGRWEDGKMRRWKDGKMGRWEDGKMGRWEDGKMRRWKDGKMGRWEYLRRVFDEWWEGYLNNEKLREFGLCLYRGAHIPYYCTLRPSCTTFRSIAEASAFLSNRLILSTCCLPVNRSHLSKPSGLFYSDCVLGQPVQVIQDHGPSHNCVLNGHLSVSACGLTAHGDKTQKGSVETSDIEVQAMKHV